MSIVGEYWEELYDDMVAKKDEEIRILNEKIAELLNDNLQQEEHIEKLNKRIQHLVYGT